jgi:hypothetical protein
MEIDTIDRDIERQPQKRKKSESIYDPIEPIEPDEQHYRSELISSPDMDPGVYFAERVSAANRACWYVGFFLLSVGVVGFVAPNVWEFHFGYGHNLINLFAGVLTMWIGITRKGPTAKSFALWAGALFMLWGVSGFIFGQHLIVDGAVQSRYFMTWSEGSLEFGRWDHYLHAIVGLALFMTGAVSKSKMFRT